MSTTVSIWISGRMKKNKKLPKLEKRGKYWEYRLRVSGKLERVSTSKEDFQQASKILEEVIEKRNLIKSEAIDKKSKEKILNIFHEESEVEKRSAINIEDIHSEWIKHYPRYRDLDEGTKEFYFSIFTRFLNWAFSEGIAKVDEVSNKIALEYATYLWDNDDEPISGKTFNHHVTHLSQVFSTLDAVYHLPERNPFNCKIVHRKRKSELNTANHMPLEPDMLGKVIAEAAKHGRGFRDLNVLSANTGLRLEDASCLKWDAIGEDFIDVVPGKTRRSGNKARIPISPSLAKLIEERRRTRGKSEFFIPEIAEYYIRSDDYVKRKCSEIFKKALGDTMIKVPAGEHRKRDANVFSFHSFRTTMMSLLAGKDVSVRDAMRIMAWESAEMIKVYEKELEKARGDSDTRAVKLINSIDELKIDLPDVPDVPEPELAPTPEAIAKLVEKYSNITIGKIYGVSEAAVRKWLNKLEIVRGRRIESVISDEEIEKIRKNLLLEAKK
jgi:integrase